jgi:tetratricopeptide (TPR) repeat protein
MHSNIDINRTDTRSPEADAVLRACVAAINDGHGEDAEAQLSPLLAAHPAHPGALYLGGMIASMRQDWRMAEDRLRRALAAAPAQPRILLLLSQALRAQGRAAEAAALYRPLAAAKNAASGLRVECALAMEESGDMQRARRLYRLAWGRGGDPAAALGLARLLSSGGQASAAEALLRQALAGSTADASMKARLEHQLGVALKMQQRWDEAIGRMRAAAACAPLDRRSSLERASLLRQMSRPEEAVCLYESLLETDPLDLDVHLLLNELRHSLGEAPALLASYDQALRRAPGAVQLPLAKGRLLLKLGRPDEAKLAFQAALALSAAHPGALAGLARALELLGDLSGADAAHAANISAQDGDALEAYAAFLLRHEDAARAGKLAEAAIRLRPASQGAWALLGLCLRQAGSARADWLNDYRRHVRVFDLAPPHGYGDMAAFNRDLAAGLEQLHAAGHAYLTQTLRGGTQTHEEIFYNGHGLVDRLLPRITAAVQTYIREMADDPSHPLPARRGRGFRYGGSWSSQLGDRGFHVNHIHQRGWISSCYYVAMPGVAEDATAQQGWLKFGEASEDFGPRFTPCRSIQPLPGRLVLFPSYMWHGTIAFHDPQKRTTIAFDAIPA